MKKTKTWSFIAAFATIVIVFAFVRKEGDRCSEAGTIVTENGAVEIGLLSEARHRYGTIPLDEVGIQEFVLANPNCCYAVALRGSVIDRIFRRRSEFDVTLKYRANREVEKLFGGKFYEAAYTVDSCGKIRERQGGFSTS
ncbi:hypothetical protein [Massilia sp. Mn16-1_5]|uniref:hypothetical protein n=1 Tax=Massilia sp. Mn16-1_5 TaxID=2079199 RepID=UPI00109EC1F7|nr:hypothetical protein [Massilia sp. Mn16-1_5]